MNPRWPLSLIVVSLAGCSGRGGNDAGSDALEGTDTTAPCSPTGTPALYIYGPDPNNPATYAPLTDGAVVPLIAGSQGGQHVWIQLQIENLCPQMPRPVIRLYRLADGALVGNNPGTVMEWEPDPAQPGRFHSPALAAQIYDSAFCGLLGGGQLRVEASVNDQLGHSAMASLSLVVGGWSLSDSDPNELARRASCCANACDRLCYPLGAPDAGTSGGDSGCGRDAGPTDAPGLE